MGSDESGGVTNPAHPLTFKCQLNWSSLPSFGPAPDSCELRDCGQVQSKVCGEADAEGALDGFCPAPDNVEAGAASLYPRNCDLMNAVRLSGPGLFVFAPADRRLARRSGSASGSVCEAAEAAARAARRAALKTYRKFSHAGRHSSVLSRLMLDT